jgi:hypothetical protein
VNLPVRRLEANRNAFGKRAVSHAFRDLVLRVLL